jgi:hypothetical protein
MALWLKEWGYSPEQVQDFYPTPGTISTVMYYTGINPMTGKPVYVCTDYREKQLQRALLQFSRPENANLVREALVVAGREDLIGTAPGCLVRPARESSAAYRPKKGSKRGSVQTADRPEGRAARGGFSKSGPYQGKGASHGTKSCRGERSEGRNGQRGDSRTQASDQRKKSARGQDKFYQPILDKRKPKLSKLERVFGDEARQIEREAAKMAEGGGKKKRR